jgi:hypothetical protein
VKGAKTAIMALSRRGADPEDKISSVPYRANYRYVTFTRSGT